MSGVIRLDDPAVVVRLSRSARARRFTLSLRGGEARLTVPSHARETEARMFLLRQSDWLRDALARAPLAHQVAVGSHVLIDGLEVAILDSGRARGPCVLRDGALLAPAANTGAAVAAFLRAHAQASLAPTARAAAAALKRPVGRISFRDTRSRWGSCTAAGDLAFSWRLAMAPPSVRAYVAVHEAAHLVEMNHAPAFWRVVASLRPGYAADRAWLRAQGAQLHRYKFAASKG